MTVPKQLTAVLLLLTVVLGSALVLRPTGTTLAAWSDEVTVPVPALRTGGVRMDVSPATVGTVATVGMSGELGGTWRPSSVRVTADGRTLTGRELAGSKVEYRLAGSDGTCSPTGTPTYTALVSGAALSFPVTGGERLSGAHTLCLTFVPTDQVRILLGGATLSFTTTIDGVSQAPATWTTAGSWAATQQLAAGPSISGPTCDPGFLNQRVTLAWEWDRADLSQDVGRWSVQLEENGSWREVASVAAEKRSITVSPYQFDFISFATYTLRVAAVLPDGTTVPGATSTDVRVERIGIGAAYCA